MTIQHNRIATITGVSGSGKDFLLERFKDSGCSTSKFPVVSFGDMLAQRLQSEDILLQQENRDAIRKLKTSLISSHIKALLQNVVSLQPVILNSHSLCTGQDIGNQSRFRAKATAIALYFRNS